MRLTFNTNAFVLVKSWKTSTTYGLLLALVVACVAACGYEWLRFFLAGWDRRNRGPQTKGCLWEFLLRLWRSCLQSVGATGSYVIMLFLMTYDLSVFLATLLGAGLGFFFFAPLFIQRDIMRPEAPVEGKLGSDGYAFYSCAAHDPQAEPTAAPLLTSLPVDGGSKGNDEFFKRLIQSESTDV